MQIRRGKGISHQVRHVVCVFYRTTVLFHTLVLYTAKE